MPWGWGVSSEPAELYPCLPSLPSIPPALCSGLTPLLSMQVALLRGQSQLRPVQPGSHTHSPIEQRPRSVKRGRDRRVEPHSYMPFKMATHPLQWASGSSVVEAAPQFSGIFFPLSCLLLRAE
uniref:Uncharacterized protein n=1 Tax=Mus musculus TaxID=10090 RepID=Q3USL0_MOUSE|nr:unnamed protein product [Mus musculus]BAE24321.1 unnamed protein product [Mus musculus]